ncbi:MAG: YvcK family protein [Candidatus Omnitrophica bacterium]|nr:YvcK family protein [Candidatus Omnitrophota bacterium]MBU4303121.1 YvcK family protein [Candidatus Omnitrophota bacterium]MBU4467806.1 YvcK family protein [Candidatus Omnitrophota bacterium]MCG2708315.1 YvcK family protein [Candidatus Omnitrophota bacterium]
MKTNATDILKWFYPGIGIKRWVGLSAFGVVLLILGTANLRSEEFWLIQILDALIVISGIIILILGIKRLMRSFIAIFVPSSSRGTELIDILYQKKHLSRGPRIVTVGGGTGLSVLLSGLKNFTSNISAVVTVADNGGSSGRLRQQFDVLPPGDIRNCLVALADAPALMRDLFQFRFDEHSEFSGHSFGNLFLTVMTRLTGDFEKAIKETSKVLALRGQVIPSTLGDVTLVAHYSDGSMVIGEEQIPRARKSISRVSLTPEQPLATPDALKAIKEAQIIVLGPGSLYTSIIPNLLIKEITQEIAESEAIKVYVCNVMTQPGETDGYSVSDHIKALLKHSHEQILDYCVVNNGEVPSEVLKRYSKDNSLLVVNDRKKVENLGVRVVEEDFSMIADGVIRHDAEKLAKIILSFIDEI